MSKVNYFNKFALSENPKIIPDDWTLTSTSLINIFIGPNNSGKSREIRDIFKSDSKTWVTDNDSLPIEVFAEYCQSLSVKSPIVRNLVNQRYIKNWPQFNIEVNEIISKPIPANISNVVDLVNRDNKAIVAPQHKEHIIAELVSELCAVSNFDLKEFQRREKILWARVYIPTLRSLRHVSVEDLYKKRTVNDYFPGGSSLNIFTGHSLYEDLKALLLGAHEDRMAVKRYEDYLSENFFFGQDIALVPRNNEDVVYFKEGDNEERPIYDLGDGIQSIIMLTFKVFMATKPTIFFIEEPEHFLHAGLQRTLIETFCKYPEHMFFMTTHSNHFLDLAQENPYISIQQVRRVNNETVVTPANSYGEVLTDLGVRASSVLLANCSIWVEGVTDKLYLRFYMKKFIQDLKKKGNRDEAAELESFHENLHYTFVEYQGSNITHWSFDDEVESSSEKTPAKRLNNKVLLIADADIQGKGDRVEELFEQLGADFHLLKWKEIENYIPIQFAVETAKNKWATFRGKGEATERIDNLLTKEENPLQSETRGLGLILEGYVDKNGVEKNFFKEKSGTIKDKVNFCRKAIELMEQDSDWELTPELEQLCRKIWAHIKESN